MLSIINALGFAAMQAVPEKYGTGREDLNVKAVEAVQRMLAKGPVRAELRNSVVAV